MKYKRIVVKIGTSLFMEGGNFTKKYISLIVDDIARIREKGLSVVIVSSGAVGCGMEEIGISEYPKTIPERQVTASIGQPRLMSLYDELFSKYNQKIAQILLTHKEISERGSYLNILNTFSLLFSLGVIPIVNENDSVSIEELRFGDNDTLSAYISILIDADILVILTDKDGLYRLNKNGDFEGIIPVIEKITGEIEACVKDEKREITIGGMKTKIEAGRITTGCGIPLIIANGKKENTLLKIIQGEKIGTIFTTRVRKALYRKRWLKFGLKEEGRIIVDKGCWDALIKGGSLLPAGIIDVEGSFNEGAGVLIIDKDKNKIAKGISSYSSYDIKRIKGKKTEEIENILGYKYRDEIVHHNNMVILQKAMDNR